MARDLKALALIALLTLPTLVVAYPSHPAGGQTQPGVVQESFSRVVPMGEWYYHQIVISTPSIIGYATSSNATIYTVFLDQQEYASFQRTGDVTNSIFWQQGTAKYNALLEGPGTYYLVAYAATAKANVTGLYIINPNVDLRDSTTSVGELITIPPGQSSVLPLHIETLGSPFKVDIIGASTRIVQYSLVDNSTGQSVFTSPVVTMTNFTVYPTVSVGYNLTESPGQYFMQITDESPDPAYAYVSYTIIPANVNPYLFLFGPPSPTGIAAYGVYNNSGTLVPYSIHSSSIVGFADVTSLQTTDNKSGTHQSSLQENTVLQVNNTDGSSYTYWPQNVLAFDTGVSTVTYRNNVLNITGDGAQLSNQTIQGAGTTTVDNNNGVIQTYYGNYNSNYTYTYSLPQAWVLYTNETVLQGRGVLIQMGVRALDGPTPNKITWFDSITIEDPNVASAAFVVDGRQYTPAGASSVNGMFYDAELVFGGGAGGQAATYALNANLALFYLDQTLKPFPSLYTFGDDTAEAAYNIAVTNGNGVAVAQAGSPYYGILTNSFNASLAALVTAAIAQHPSGGLPSGDVGYAAAGILVVVIVLVALFMVMRRRGARQAVLQPSYPTAVVTRFCGNCGSPLEPDARFCPSCGAQQAPDTSSV